MITVIVPVCNETPEVIQSICELAQTQGVDELLVVDASNRQETIDNLENLQSEHETVRVIYSNTANRAYQMNLGESHAQHDILWFVHADTNVPKDAPQIILDSISSQRPWGRFDVRFTNSTLIMRLIATLINLRSAATEICTGDQAIFVNRKVFNKLGGFPEIAIMEDVALSKKLKSFGNCIRIHKPVTTSARRWETRGYLRTILLMWIMRLLFWLGVSPQRLAKLYR